MQKYIIYTLQNKINGSNLQMFFTCIFQDFTWCQLKKHNTVLPGSSNKFRNFYSVTENKGRNTVTWMSPSHVITHEAVSTYSWGCALCIRGDGWHTIGDNLATKAQVEHAWWHIHKQLSRQKTNRKNYAAVQCVIDQRWTDYNHNLYITS